MAMLPSGRQYSLGHDSGSAAMHCCRRMGAANPVVVFRLAWFLAFSVSCYSSADSKGAPALRPVPESTRPISDSAAVFNSVGRSAVQRLHDIVTKRPALDAIAKMNDDDVSAKRPKTKSQGPADATTFGAKIKEAMLQTLHRFKASNSDTSESQETGGEEGCDAAHLSQHRHHYDALDGPVPGTGKWMHRVRT